MLLPSTGPRLIVYHQTFHDSRGQYYSLLPLLTNHTGITHVIIASIHVNEGPGNITLNDSRFDDDTFRELWAEVKLLQVCGIKVLGMVGGAAKGSFKRLGGNDANFEAYYAPFYEIITTTNLDGIDIDVEEDVPIATVTRLIGRLRADFGPKFLITLAPVASALIPNPFILEKAFLLNPNPICRTAPSLLHPTLPHLSGFSYPELERSAYGQEIAWYNTQFYGGWGNALSSEWYDAVIEAGWNPERIVLGVVTNPQEGAGYVPINTLMNVSVTLRDKYRGFKGGFGGVMGWEYFNGASYADELGGICRSSFTSIEARNADWVLRLGRILRVIE